MYHVVFRHKYAVSSGTVSAGQLENTIGNYLSRGYTVERITKQESKKE